MKYLFTLLFSCTLITAQSQRFTVGILSGTGFSDIHGNAVSGKWENKTGPLSGVFLNYSITKVLGIGTELNYTSQGYYYIPYESENYYYPPVIPASSSYYSPYWAYYPVRKRWDYSFLRIPIYLTLSTPTRLKLSVSAGVYLAFIQDHEYSGQSPSVYPDYIGDIYYYPTNEKTPHHDNGLMYATSLSYPMNGAFNVYAMGRYFIGHKSFIGGSGRTGAYELAIGVSYTGLFKTGKVTETLSSQKDSSKTGFLISTRAGLNYSYYSGSGSHRNYDAKTGFSSALWLEYRLNKSVSLLSGVGFDRKGYRMNDSSAFYYRKAMANLQIYQANTKVDIDYAVIPLLMKIRMGSGPKIYVLGGPYVGIKLNARVTGNAEEAFSSAAGYNYNKIEVYDDLDGRFKNTDFGCICGAGIEMPLANGNILDLGLQYATGFRDILQKDDTYLQLLSGADGEIHNGSINFLVGLTIPIHKSK